MATKYGWWIAAVALATFAPSCTDQAEETMPAPQGVPAYIDATLEDMAAAETRVQLDNNDVWSVVNFTSSSDVAGMYATKGRQNPDDPDDFSLPVTNAKMTYEGKNSNGTYRFGNSDVVLDPASVTGVLYYPYYAQMPETTASGVKGITLRKMDNNVEKCIDFMRGSVSLSSDKRMTISFAHNFSSIVLLRGTGFDKPQDPRIWVVQKEPKTDIRITQTSATSGFSYTTQYTPDAGEDVWVDLAKIADPNAEEELMVNKYAVWESWSANSYKEDGNARYVLIPIVEVYYIYIQDNFGHWQKVSDFYLTSVGSKSPAAGTRYALTIQLEGLKVVVRPVSVTAWSDELDISSNRKRGINAPDEYNEFVAEYNNYIETGRNESRVSYLNRFGDAQKILVEGSPDVEEGQKWEYRWTFYINADIKFEPNAFWQITRLDDVIEGSSTSNTFKLTKPAMTMAETLGPNGAIKALEFRDISFVQNTDDENPFGALVGTMDGGTIEKCNIVQGVIVSGNEAGMIAGTVTDKGGTVKNCTISGNVIGKSSYEGKGLFGKIEGPAPTEADNNLIGLKFINYYQN